jgi:hypothetical protein
LKQNQAFRRKNLPWHNRCFSYGANDWEEEKMNWQFWKKNNAGKGVKLPKPKDLPSAVGRYLVVNLQYDPDWVWQLKSVSRAREARKGEFDFRIFDPAAARAHGVLVQNYLSLDDRGDLILFDGWYDTLDWKMEILDRHKPSYAEGAA